MVTVSIGIAASPEAGFTETIVARADAALLKYKA
jgi:GGDEF domain-containing protein